MQNFPQFAPFQFRRFRLRRQNQSTAEPEKMFHSQRDPINLPTWSEYRRALFNSRIQPTATTRTEITNERPLKHDGLPY
jgi:hypothetical protein